MSGKRSKKMRTRNKILAIAAVFIAAFIVYTLAVYTYNGWQWVRSRRGRYRVRIYGGDRRCR